MAAFTLQQNLAVGQLFIGVLSGEVDVGIEVDVGDLDVVRVEGIFVDNSIGLFIILVAVGEIFLGCEDIDIDILVEAGDIVNRLIRQLEDLIGGQVDAEGVPIHEDGDDDVHQDDRCDEADREDSRHRTMTEAAAAVKSANRFFFRFINFLFLIHLEDVPFVLVKISSSVSFR